MSHLKFIPRYVFMHPLSLKYAQLRLDICCRRLPLPLENCAVFLSRNKSLLYITFVHTKENMTVRVNARITELLLSSPQRANIERNLPDVFHPCSLVEEHASPVKGTYSDTDKWKLNYSASSAAIHRFVNVNLPGACSS